MSTVERERVKRKIERKVPPPQRLRALLIELRGDGVADFDEAWDLAWARMVSEKAFPHATVERRQWKVVLRSTRAEWRRCWDGEPSPFNERVVMMLLRVSHEEIVADDGVMLAAVLG